jgi:hypothetical protein
VSRFHRYVFFYPIPTHPPTSVFFLFCSVPASHLLHLLLPPQLLIICWRIVRFLHSFAPLPLRSPRSDFRFITDNGALCDPNGAIGETEFQNIMRKQIRLYTQVTPLNPSLAPSLSLAFASAVSIAFSLSFARSLALCLSVHCPQLRDLSHATVSLTFRSCLACIVSDQFRMHSLQRIHTQIIGERISPLCMMRSDLMPRNIVIHMNRLLLWQTVKRTLVLAVLKNSLRKLAEHLRSRACRTSPSTGPRTTCSSRSWAPSR